MNIILCTNNNYTDPFLHSQLLNIYKEIDSIDDIYLFCRTDKKEKNIINISYGKFSFLVYFFKLFLFLFNLKNENTTIHLRGFVSAFIFFFVQKIIFWKKFKYIYDPRGAFVIELKESKFSDKDNFLLKMLKLIEKNLIENSIKTIVTTERFKELFVNQYGLTDKLIVLYNTSSFNCKNIDAELIKDRDIVNICYVGSVNYWHDLDEIIRVLSYTKNTVPQKTKIYFFTNFKDMSLIKEKLEKNNILDYDIKFVPYEELESRLIDMDICISVVKPTISTKIASPIKVSDYIMLNKRIIMNKDIGDFDDFFIKNNSAQLYEYGGKLDFTFEDILNLNIEKNDLIKDKLFINENISIIKTCLETNEK